MPGQDWRATSPERFDLDRVGAGYYRLQLPYRWQGEDRTLDYPLAVIGRGRGPSVLVTGGTHGDEPEGQAVAHHLIQGLAAEEVSGRLILVPSHNRPACLAGTRHSPIDGLDLNRIYPGGEEQGPTHAIARFLSRSIMPRCDAFLDLHSGGKATRFVLSSNLQGRPGAPDVERDLPALLAMNAPFALLFDEDGGQSMPHRGTAEAYFRALGRPAFSSEFGGGFITARSFRVALQSSVNLLRHLGVLQGRSVAPDESRSRLLFMDGGACYVPAPASGLLIPEVDLGSEVAAGDLLGRVVADSPAEDVLEIAATVDGTLVAMATHLESATSTAFMIARHLTSNRNDLSSESCSTTLKDRPDRSQVSPPECDLPSSSFAIGEPDFGRPRCKARRPCRLIRHQTRSRERRG